MYEPVNVPGAASGDMEEVRNAVKTAQAAANEAKQLVDSLKKSILDGTIVVKTKSTFPVVAADPASPEQGEAWILADKT